MKHNIVWFFCFFVSLKCGAEETDPVTDVRKRAEARIAAIRESPNLVMARDVEVYYISEKHGNDSADGRSPATAWRTSIRLNGQGRLGVGSWVLFERGGTYRGTVKTCSGVTYSAYGMGPKPRIYGSPENGADSKRWQRTENPNIWAYDIGHQDVGTLVFDEGMAHAVKIVIRTDKKDGKRYNKFTGGPFRSYLDLDHDLHFWHDYGDQGTGKIYLYSEKNPGERFRSIEFNVKCSGFDVGSASDVAIDNFNVRYVGVHGVAAENCRNLTVSNCEFGWIGGSIQGIFGHDYPTRLGNGVEVYGRCDGYVVSNCYFKQIYDAGVTHQCDIPEAQGKRRYDQKHVKYIHNVFVNCNYSVEYFLTAKNGNPSLMEDVRVQDNIMLDAGYGFPEQRPNRGEAAHIKGRFCKERNRAKDFVICGNVMCLSVDMLVQTCTALKNADGSSSLPRFDNNVLIGRHGDCLGQVSEGATIRKPYDANAEAFVNTFGFGNRCVVLPRCLKSRTANADD